MKARIKHLICAGICGTLLLALVFCMGTVSVFAAENQENSLVNNWGMTLNDEIIVKFQMSFTPEILEDTGAYVEVSVGDHSYEVPVAQIEDHLPVPVFATQMTEVITLCVVDGSGGRGEENSFTVKEYCQALLGNVAYASYHPLVKELLNYGNAAQKYFDYNPGDLAGTDVDLTGAGQNAVPTTGTQFALDDRSSILDCYGASLVYRDKIAIRFYFKGEGSLTDCTFAVTGASGEPVINEAESYVEVGDIVPQDFDKAITLTVTDQLGKNIDVTYCPMDYIIRMSCNGSDNSKALVKALYNYHLAAKNFVPVESFTVSFDMNYEGATETPEAITVAAGGAYGELPVPQRENYDFGGWYKDAACSGDAATDETTVSASHTLYAKWIAVEPDPEESPAIVAGMPENLTYATAEQKAAVGINASKTMYRYTKAAGVSANDADPASIYFSNENGYDYISFDFYFVSMPAGQQDGKPYMAMKAYKYLTGNTSNTAQDANTLDLTIVNKATGEANTEYVGTETWGKVEMNTWYTMTCKVTDWAKLNLVLWSSASAEMYFANVRGYEDPNAVADTTVAMTPGGKVTVGQWPSQFTFPVSSGESIALTANGNTVGQEHYTVANGNLVLFDSYYKTFADGTYTFAVNNTAYTLIKKTSDFLITEKYLYKASGSMNYYAWPSVAEIGGGKLLAVASQRMEHVDPYGRVVGFLSEDGGNTWSEPFVIADTLLDDRDAGIVYWQGKIIVTWFTHSRNYYLSSGNSEWIAHCQGITDAQDAQYAGGLVTVSEDEGKTWSAPQKIDVFTPHGIQVMPNGNLGYIGYVGYDRSINGFNQGMGMITSTDGKNWSAVTPVAGNGYDEPGYVFIDESTILVYLRKADGLYMCKSTNGGASFSEPTKIMSDVANTPAHILTTSSGVLVMTYGHRSAPYGLQAKVSFDKGDSWSEAITLTDDGFEWDLGYSCTTELPDGTLYTNYYQKQESGEANTCIMGVHWTLDSNKEFTVTFDSNGGSEVAPISGKFGDAMTKPEDPIRDGYSFLGWYTANGGLYTFSAFTETVTLTAKWKNESSIPELIAQTPANLTLATDAQKQAVGIAADKKMYIYTKHAGVSANDAGPDAIYLSNELEYDYITFYFYIAAMPAGQENGMPYMAMKAYRTMTGNTADAAQDANTLGLTIVESTTGLAPDVANAYTGSATWGNVKMGTWYTMTCKVTDWAKLNLVLWQGTSATVYFTNIKGHNGEVVPDDPFVPDVPVVPEGPAIIAVTPEYLVESGETEKTAVGIDPAQKMYTYTKPAGVSANNNDAAAVYISNEDGYDYITFDFYFVSMPAGQENGMPYMSMVGFPSIDYTVGNRVQSADALGLTIVEKATGNSPADGTLYTGTSTWGNVKMNTWYTMTCKLTDYERLQSVLWGSTSATMYFTNIKGHIGEVTPDEPEVKFEVSFNLNYVDAPAAPTAMQITEGNSYGTLPVPEREGYTFGGWYTDAACSGTAVSATDTVTASHTLYAKWSGLMSIPDFVVEIPEGRDPIVLQLTDPQIIDATQQRSEDRLGGLYNQYLPENMDARCFDYMRETIEAVNPDLIILTGDLVYGEFDDDGTSLLKLVEFMDSFEIPWAPIMGNHEAETTLGVDWQCDVLENSTYCLFDQKELTGNGNYSVGIAQGGKLTRVFYMVDSNGTGASTQSLANGHTKTTAGFGQDQIDWYTDEINAIHALSPDTKISFAFHIQIAAFADAYAKYGFTNSGTINNPINIDFLENKEDGDFGYLGRDLKSSWDTDKIVFNGLKALGVDSIFVGHEHCNSASVVWEGIRFQYGQKSSTYDRYNYVNMANGAIVGSYNDGGTPLIGGTVIPLSAETGEIVDPYIFLCENAGGNIDWDQWKPAEDIVVDGLSMDECTLEAAISARAVNAHGANAYEVYASSQGKIKLPVDRLNGKVSLTFTVYIPSGSTQLAGLGELAIRYKASSGNGYIAFNTNDGAANKVEPDTWNTVTVPLTSYSGLTEFSFVIPAGNTYHIKGITITGDEETVNVSFNLNYETTETAPATITREQGAVYGTLPEVEREGYTFGGWFLTETCDGTAVRGTSVVSSSHTLYAKWTENAPEELEGPAIIAVTPEYLVESSETEKTAVGIDPAKKMYTYTKAAGVSANNNDAAAVYFSNEAGYDYITFDFYFVSMPAGQEGGMPYMAMKAYQYLDYAAGTSAQSADALGLTIVEKATGNAPTDGTVYTGTLTWGNVKMNTWYTMTCKMTDYERLQSVLWKGTSATMYFTNIKGHIGEVTPDEPDVPDVPVVPEGPAIIAVTPEYLVESSETEKTAVGIDPAKKMYTYTKAAGVSANNNDAAAVYFSNEAGYDYITFDFYFVSMPAGQEGGMPYMAMKAYQYLDYAAGTSAQSADALGLTIVEKATGNAPTDGTVYTGTLTWGNVKMNTWYTMTCKVTDWARLSSVLWSSTSATMYFTNIQGTNE